MGTTRSQNRWKQTSSYFQGRNSNIIFHSKWFKVTDSKANSKIFSSSIISSYITRFFSIMTLFRVTPARYRVTHLSKTSRYITRFFSITTLFRVTTDRYRVTHLSKTSSYINRFFQLWLYTELPMISKFLLVNHVWVWGISMFFFQFLINIEWGTSIFFRFLDIDLGLPIANHITLLPFNNLLLVPEITFGRHLEAIWCLRWTLFQ